MALLDGGLQAWMAEGHAQTDVLPTVADVVVEVLDARLPQASSNPMIHELRIFRQRPCLKLLNKADLADPEVTKAWLPCHGLPVHRRKSIGEFQQHPAAPLGRSGNPTGSPSRWARWQLILSGVT